MARIGSRDVERLELLIETGWIVVGITPLLNRLQ